MADQGLQRRYEIAEAALKDLATNYSVGDVLKRISSTLDSADLPSVQLQKLQNTTVFSWGGDLRTIGSGILRNYIEAAILKESNRAQSRSAEAANNLSIVNLILAAVGVVLAAVQVWVALRAPH